MSVKIKNQQPVKQLVEVKDAGKQKLGKFTTDSHGDHRFQTRTRCPNHKWVKIRAGGECPHCHWPNSG